MILGKRIELVIFSNISKIIAFNLLPPRFLVLPFSISLVLQILPPCLVPHALLQSLVILGKRIELVIFSNISKIIAFNLLPPRFLVLPFSISLVLQILPPCLVPHALLQSLVILGKRIEPVIYLNTFKVISFNILPPIEMCIVSALLFLLSHIFNQSQPVTNPSQPVTTRHNPSQLVTTRLNPSHLQPVSSTRSSKLKHLLHSSTSLGFTVTRLSWWTKLPWRRDS